MLTPAPTLLPPLSLADRFWSYAAAGAVEPDDAPEPLRSVLIVRQFLASLDRLDATSPRKAAAAMVAMLRQSELDGDLSYASPEQVRGEILDTRSVVFSLGVVLFERITGRHPFGAENNRPRRIDRIRKGELGSGVNSFPTVNPGLRSVLVRAMSPFPEERWPDLRQMRELLGQFLTQETPAPKLPGTEGNTRVVRMATDFGRELMEVVARNDRPDRAVTIRPADEPTKRPMGANAPENEMTAARGQSPRGTRTSQRIAIPTAGVGAVTGANAAPGTTRRPTQRTPKAGVTLRPVPPSPEPLSDSVVTRVHPSSVDPLAATMRFPTDVVRAPSPEAEDSAPILLTSVHRARTVPSPPPDEARRPPRPTPRPTPAPRTPAETRAALAASLPPLPPLPSPPQPVDLPLPAPPESFASLPAPPRKRRAVALTAIGAAIGGTAALALLLSIGSSPTATASAVAASPTSPAPTPPSPPALTPTPAAASLEPAAVADPPPSIEAQLAAAISPCVTTSHVFGLSLLYRYGVISKPYYASGDGLTPEQHGCIGKALKGQSLAGAPHSGVVEYKVRVSNGVMTVSPWK